MSVNVIKNINLHASCTNVHLWSNKTVFSVSKTDFMPWTHKYIYFICEVSLYCIYDVPYIEFSSKMHYWFLSLHIVTHGTFCPPISYSFIVSHTYRYLTPCNCTYLDIHRITYMPTTAHFSKFSSFRNMCRRRHAPGLTNIYFLTFIRLRSNHVAPYFESIIIYYFS